MILSYTFYQKMYKYNLFVCLLVWSLTSQSTIFQSFYAAFTPSTICYECHDWPIAADRDTFLIFQVKIRDIVSPCDQIRFSVLGHDWSISDDPICYNRIDRSDKTPWIWVRSPRLGSPIWYDLMCADTFRCVTTRSLRPDALCCDRIRNALSYCPDHDKRWSRFIHDWAKQAY